MHAVVTVPAPRRRSPGPGSVSRRRADGIRDSLHRAGPAGAQRAPRCHAPPLAYLCSTRCATLIKLDLGVASCRWIGGSDWTDERNRESYQAQTCIGQSGSTGRARYRPVREADARRAIKISRMEPLQGGRVARASNTHRERNQRGREKGAAASAKTSHCDAIRSKDRMREEGFCAHISYLRASPTIWERDASDCLHKRPSGAHKRSWRRCSP